MKLIGAVVALAACGPVAAAAQEIKTTTKEKTKCEIKKLSDSCR